jgi:hypothetical protein
MRIRKMFARVPLVFVSALIASALPSAVLAAGIDDKPGASKPRPDLAGKVYTNDDLGWRSATPAPAGEVQPGQTSDAIPIPASSSANQSSAGSASTPPLSSERDPRWYAQRQAQLEAQLAAIESKQEQLRDFRASGSTESQPTGLVLNAPCEGITTDNEIAQLDAQRQAITQQLDELDDTARANGLSSGVIAQASAAGSRPPTPEQEREHLASRYRQLSGEISQTQAQVADMQQQAALQNISLLPSTPGQGGNMTTDLLSRLANRSENLQNEASGVEDQALSQGVQPGDLR